MRLCSADSPVKSTIEGLHTSPVKEPESLAIYKGESPIAEETEEQEPTPQAAPAPYMPSSNLSNLLTDRKNCREEELISLDQIVEIDSQIMSYGKFISGKILGSTLMLTNKTSAEQSFEVKVDGQNSEY